MSRAIIRPWMTTDHATAAKPVPSWRLRSQKIQPIETSWAGCRFRSRTEARWAAFFTDLGIQWEYEPEAYATSQGNYLPDFRLTASSSQSAWFEVKGPDQRMFKDERWGALAELTRTRVYVAFGFSMQSIWSIDGCEADGSWKSGFAFKACQGCRLWMVALYATDHSCPNCKGVTSAAHSRIVNAHHTAASMRFEPKRENRP